MTYLKTYGLYALAIALALAVAWGLVERSRAAGYKADVAAIAQKHAEAVTLSVTAALAASQSYRAEEARREDEKQEAVRHAQETSRQHLADATAARAESDGLRADVAKYRAAARRAAANPTTGAGSPAGSDPLDLLAVMFYESDDLAGRLAQEADRSRLAGLTCERQYDSLTGPAK